MSQNPNLNVETATDQVDLPHQFEAFDERGTHCGLCQAFHGDPRHMAWEIAHRQQQVREQAQANGEGIPRETA